MISVPRADWAAHGHAAGHSPRPVRRAGQVTGTGHLSNRIIGHRAQIHSPNLNAYAERMQQTLQVECLDKFLVIGTKHLDYLVREYLDHYNTERPHSGIGFSVPEKADARPNLKLAPSRPAPVGRVRCKERLGGVIKHYTRMAA